jgi:hypothetical protein
LGAVAACGGCRRQYPQGGFAYYMTLCVVYNPKYGI